MVQKCDPILLYSIYIASVTPVVGCFDIADGDRIFLIHVDVL